MFILSVFLHLYLIQNTNAQADIWYYPMSGGAPSADWAIESGSYTPVTSDSNCPSSLTECWSLNGSVINQITRTASTVSWTNVELTYQIRSVGVGANERCYVDYFTDNTNWNVITEVKTIDTDTSVTHNTWSPVAEGQESLIIRLHNLNYND
eukprot:31315_1